jgi:hypothetical protein
MLKSEHFNFDTLVRLFQQDAEQMVLIVGLCILTYFFIHFVISFRDKASNNGTYRWFLFNCIFIHILMDGLVGYFHLIKPYRLFL